MPVQSLLESGEFSGGVLVDAGAGAVMLLDGTFLLPSVIATILEIAEADSEAAGDRAVDELDDTNPVVTKLDSEVAATEVVVTVETAKEVADLLVSAADAAEALKSQSFATEVI